MDIVELRLVFVTGLIALAVVVSFVGYGIARWQEQVRGRTAGRGRADAARRYTVKHSPLRGTR